MSDDKDQHERDRGLVAGGERYEVRYFAEKHGLSTQQVEQLIQEHGNDREKLDEAARKLKGSI